MAQGEVNRPGGLLGGLSKKGFSATQAVPESRASPYTILSPNFHSIDLRLGLSVSRQQPADDLVLMPLEAALHDDILVSVAQLKDKHKF
jgi:hypothetical protein